MARLRSRRLLQGVHRRAAEASARGMQTARCWDNQPESGSGKADLEPRCAFVARRRLDADVVDASAAHSILGEQRSTQAVSDRLLRTGAPVQRAGAALATGRLVQGEHRNAREGGMLAPVGMGTAGAVTGHTRDQTNGVRAAGVGEEEQGSTGGGVERRCTTHHRRRSRPASKLCLHMDGSQGSSPSFRSSEQLRLESRPTSGGSAVSRGAGAACARGIQEIGNLVAAVNRIANSRGIHARTVLRLVA